MSEHDTEHTADDAASSILAAIHPELRRIASSALQNRGGHIDATDLAHQAWLKVADRVGDLDRSSFLALCATVMRHLVVDEARRYEREERHQETLIGLRPDPGSEGEERLNLLALDEALARLANHDERWMRVVELRFFGGLTIDEVAKVLGLSTRSVNRAWLLARAWLQRELSD